MKFLLSKDLEYSRLLTNLMVGVSAALFFYLGLDILLHAYILGADINAILDTLYGNTEAFIEPVLFDTLLLQVHIDLFMSLFTIMIIASIYIRLYHSHKHTKLLAHIVFILGLAAPVFLVIAYYTSVFFVYVWLFTFLLGHLLVMGLALLIMKRLLFK